MDEDMWHHPSTKKNIETLQLYGNKIIDVGTGELASGLFGEGRMAEPEDIILYLEENIFRLATLQGKKALVTAGPTHEALDPVRFLGNHSSGKMGFALAEELYMQGADVWLVSGPSQLKPKYAGIHFIPVKSAKEMFDACMQLHNDMNIEIMAAAVADYTPAVKSGEKIKKTDDELTITFEKTNDILKTLGQNKKNGQYLTGFALETNNEKEYALSKLKNKNADMIVLNSLRDENAGFGFNTNKVTIFTADKEEIDLPLTSKTEIAQQIIHHIIQKTNA